MSARSRRSGRLPRVALVLAACALPAALHGQAREWTTSRYDAQRTGWVRSDPRISRASIDDGTFQFLWKARFDNEARQLESLTEPVLQDFLVGYRGFKSLAFLGATSDRLFAIDTDLNKPYWTRELTYAAATGGRPPSSWDCPGGMLAAPSRRTPMAPSAFAPGGGRRGGRATSAVGQPGKGAAILAEMAARAAGSGDAPPPAPPPTPRRVEPVPFGGVDPIYTMGSDGLLRTLRVTDGDNMAPPIPFLPPDTRPTALLYVDGVVYTTTSHGCGAAPNAVWALDTTADAPRTVRWETGGPDIAGTVALGTDGTVYVATAAAPPGREARYAGSVVALDRFTLALKGSFTLPGVDFNTSPMVIRHDNRDLVAVAAGDGRLYLLDGASLGGADGRTPLHVTPKYTAPGASAGLATWDDGETRWVLAPAVGAPPAGGGFSANGPAPRGSIVAFKLKGADAAVTLEPAWRSADLASPLAPIVVNGVVFAAASGEYRGAMPRAGGTSRAAAARARQQDAAAARAARSVPAVLKAIDGATGRTLWTSGRTIASFARAGLAAGGGQLYVVTYDNTLYAFGIPLEH